MHNCLEAAVFWEAQYICQPHWHYFDQMFFVSDGHVELTVNDKAYSFDGPAVMFLEHLQTHTIVTDEHFRRYYLNINPLLAHTQLKEREYLLVPFSGYPDISSHVLPVAPIAPQLESLFSLLYQEFQTNDFPDYQLSLFECILHCLRRFAPQFFVCNVRPLTNAIRQLQRRFDEAPEDETSLNELAEEYHFSVSYLTHKFKQVTGYSIGKYRMMCRIAAAKRMLLTTDLPIGTISNNCGFADMSNFCRYFRQEVGCSPSVFRSKAIDFE